MRSVSEIRKEEITDAVLMIIAQHGYQSLNVRVVAEAVGMAKSSLYQHFENLEDMISAALERLHDKLMAAVEKAEAQGPTPLDQLRLLSFSYPDLAVLRAIPRIEAQCPQLLQRFKEKVKLDTHGFDHHLLRLMQRIQANGQARTDLTPAELMTTYVGLHRELMFRNLVDSGGSLEQQLEAYWQLFVKLIECPGQMPRRRRSDRGRGGQA